MTIVDKKHVEGLDTDFKVLEERLLHSDYQEQPEILDQLLDDEFEEIASSGVLVSREDVVHWLLHKEKYARWRLDDFTTRLLANGLVLTVYHARQIHIEDKGRAGSHRSSIWKKSNGHWKMIFHQATKVSGV